jgi:iron complex outermembrane receptor protein
MTVRMMLGLAGVSTLAISTAAMADTAKPVQAVSAAPTDPATLGEIIVTARKRSENVQKVSVAVSVVGADQIKKNQLVNSADLVSVAPSLNVQNGGQAAASSFVVRGIGTFSYSSGAEPSVSTVVDGVVLARSGMAFMNLADVEHVEVLRGPQGTLFGKNASAGLVNIVTKDPSRTPEGDVSLTAISAGEYHADLTASGPITDTLGVRLTGSFTNDQGFSTNVFNGKHQNGDQSYLLRGVLKWEPTDNLVFRWRSDASWSHQNGPALVMRAVDPGPQRDALLPLTPSPTLIDVNDNMGNNTVDRTYGHSLQVDWDVGGHSLTSITAYRGWKEFSEVDDDLTPLNFLGISQPDGQRLHQFSQELRLTSPSQGFLTYVAGLFYYKETINRKITRIMDLSDVIGLPIGPMEAPAFINVVDENTAAFGEATAHLSDRVRLVGGLRYTHDNLQYDYTQAVNTSTPLGAIIYPLIVAPVPLTANSTHKGHVSGKMSLEWDVLPTAMAYVSYAEGYKGPAYSLDIATPADALNRVVEPETSNAYEIGLKSAWFDHRLIANVAGFYTDYSNFQAQTLVGSGFVASFQLANAAKVHTGGVEFDVTARPLPNLNITAGATFMEAKFDQYPNGPCSGPQKDRGECPAGSQDLAGGQLPFAPKAKGFISADYTITLPDQPFDLVLLGNFHGQSSELFDVSQDPGARQKGYGILDLSAELLARDHRYSLTFFIKNVADRSFVDSIIPLGSPIAPNGYAQIVDKYSQRRFGVNLRYAFGSR